MSDSKLINVHIMINHLFTYKFINFINEEFNQGNHIFLVNNNKKHITTQHENINYNNIIYCVDNFSKFLYYVFKADKIYIHNLSLNRNQLLTLYIFKFLLNKTTWFIWGGDLHNQFNKNKLKNKIHNHLYNKIIENISEIICPVKGDYELAKKIYGTKAKYNYAFYPNPIDFDHLKKLKKQKNKDSNYTLLLGNSGSTSNNHIEILNCLYKKNLNNDLRIICPLSYAYKSKKYINEVISHGKYYFGDNFISLTEFLPPKKYAEILNSVDVAVFNHQRQQALSNIFALLYLGKKVYIRSDSPSWDYFKKLGIKVYDTNYLNDFNSEDIFKIDENVAIMNTSIIENELSYKNCIKIWENIFTS